MNMPVKRNKSSAVASALARYQRDIRGDVLFDKASRGRYSTDASIYQIMPLGVIVPKDLDDLRAAVDIARWENLPLLPRGGGTSQCGQTIGEAIVIDTSRCCNNVIEFDPIAKTVVVEPGMVLDHLNKWLKPHGLWFPVDVSTAAQCTIGGMAGNNSCGSRSIRYGNMVHNVLAIDAILADGSEQHFGPKAELSTSSRMGEIVAQLQTLAAQEQQNINEHYPKVLRRVGGYNLDIFNCQNPMPYTTDGSPNLAHLLVGSEGTLGISTQLRLQLQPLPEQKVLGVVNFPTFFQAMDFTQHIVKLNPTAVEVVDRTMIDLSMDNPSFRPVIEKALVGKPEALLLVEFAGEEQETLLRQLDDLDELMSDLGLANAVVKMPGSAEQQALWNVRKSGLNIMMSMKGDGKPVSFIEDCAVPLENLAEYTSQLSDVFLKHGTKGTWYAHASVGTLHVRPILDMRRDGAGKMRAIAEEAAALVRKYKGAYSGEHGDGICRGEWVAWQFGPQLNEAFKQIKQLFDPENLLNPGKIVNTPKMDEENLFRFPPKKYQPIPFEPVMDWSAWDVKRDPITGHQSAPYSGHDPAHGLAKAVEMCNNNGHCRKFDANTMCPSYRVTRDEKHVTRGRANTLRLALSGQIGEAGLASDEVKEALDLCVSCKGCKRECPTGVDMAKIKIEARAARLTQHKLALRDRLVGSLPRYAPYVRPFARLLSGLDRISFLSDPVKQMLGLATERQWPAINSNFLREQITPASSSNGKEVLLFIDTFNNYMESANAAAAYRVLSNAGYTVHFNQGDESRPLCCGRTYLSSGQVDRAKAEALRSLNHLMPYVDRGVPVVGLEPSCLLTMRDEFLHYGFGDKAKKLSENSFLFEEFLVREKAAGHLDLALQPISAKRALLHGHCHQKAFDVMKPVEQVLAWIPGLTVETISSSCCGMAGSFGYEKEHYETSIKMAELSLLPAVREAADSDLIIADGTSCRHQIQDGTKHEALHVARVLDQALVNVS